MLTHSEKLSLFGKLRFAASFLYEGDLGKRQSSVLFRKSDY